MFQLHPQLEKDTYWVTDLTVSRILLMNDNQFPWLIQVPMIEDAVELIDLEPDTVQTVWQESLLVSRCMKTLYAPDKLNVAALGNMVPQLHIHHIARFERDAAWPKPVWGQVSPVAYDIHSLEQELDNLRQALNQP